VKTRLSMLVAALCTLAYFSDTARVGASGPVDSSRPSAIPHAVTSDIFDPFGLLSPSQHGELTTLGTGFGFTEGPAVDRHGNVFFTDQPNDKIYRWDAGTGQITLFLQGTGRANGMAFDKDGKPDRLCRHARRALEDPSGRQP
jgi:gluconolactonase